MDQSSQRSNYFFMTTRHLIKADEDQMKSFRTDTMKIIFPFKRGGNLFNS